LKGPRDGARGRLTPSRATTSNPTARSRGTGSGSSTQRGATPIWDRSGSSGRWRCGSRRGRDPGSLRSSRRFSPDGSAVVFRASRSYLISPVGGATRESTSWPSPRRSATGVPVRVRRHFGASPDRVFFSDVVEETKLVLKSVDLSRLDPSRPEGLERDEYRVSPDGRWVAFIEGWTRTSRPSPRRADGGDRRRDAKASPSGACPEVRSFSIGSRMARSAKRCHWPPRSPRDSMPDVRVRAISPVRPRSCRAGGVGARSRVRDPRRRSARGDRPRGRHRRGTRCATPGRRAAK